MDRIPAEILVKITSFLSIKNKLRCITVSKKWAEIITASNLYSTLDFSHRREFEKAVSFFNDNKQHLAKAVNHLLLRHINMERQMLLSLPELFPKVKHLVWQDVDYYVEEEGQSGVFALGSAKEDFGQKLSNWEVVRYIHG